MILKLKLNPEKEDATELKFTFIHVLAIVPEGMEELLQPQRKCPYEPNLKKYQMVNKYMCLTDEGIRYLIDHELEYALDCDQYLVDND